MEYISLYRKYRPSRFSEVVGQKVVIEILKNSIKNNKIGHAYIFSGPRGTGKTSIAKIFSKAVNCLSGKTGDLCGECTTCKANFEDEIDIIEIDAASNNGVDEIREIRNNVKLLPAHLKYKVYIIDEVHMLSTSAFNALLKTLEEPPNNVIFILATTEFNKIPSTVVSRCQKFDFKKLTIPEINKRLNYILEQENRKLNSDVIELISKLSDGGLRDAINMLDQLISIEKEEISINDVYNLIGDISEEQIFRILDIIAKGDIKESLKEIDRLYQEGKNFINISDRLQVLIRNILIYNNTKEYFSEEYENKLCQFAKIDIDKLLKMSDELFKLSNELKKTSNQKILTEIYFLKICLNNESKKENKYEENKLENQVDNKKINNNALKEENKQDEIKKIRINNALYGANKILKNDLLKKYNNINEYTSSKEYNSVSNLLIKATPEVVSDKNIIFTFKNGFEVVLFDKNIEEIEKFLKIVFNTKYSVVAVNEGDWNKIKNEYIKNINSGKVYEYIEEIKEIKKTKNTTKLQNTVENIFGEEYITEE